MIKKTLGLFLLAILSIGIVALPTQSAVYITPVGNGNYNLVLNGDMELTENGIPLHWGLSQGVAGVNFTSEGNAGERYARLYGTQVMAIQNLTSVKAGETYTFSALVRRMRETSEALLEVRFQKPSGTSFTEISYVRTTVNNTPVGEWSTVSREITVPEEATRVGIYLRLKELANKDGEIGDNGEVHIDEVSFVGAAKAEYAAAMEFRTQLWKEAAEDESTLPASPNGLYEDNTPTEGEDNLLDNSDFENPLSGNWGTSFGEYAFHGEDKEGDKCIRFSVNGATDGAVRPFYSQRVPIVGGAEYQVSYRYKVTKGEAKPWVKLEYAVAVGLPGIGSAGEKYVTPSEIVRDGAWHSVTMKVYPPANAGFATVMPRLMQGNYQDEEEVYFDDVKIYMTYPPAFAALDGGWVFYYSDMEEGTLGTEIHPAFPAYKSAKVDYAILDGTTIIWESKNHTSSDGKTMVTFPLSLLSEKEKPYRARATIYEPDGVKARAICTQNVYLYDRPEYLGKDGVFRQNGEIPVYPMYAYHVNRAHYGKAAEAGINIVQMGAFDTVEAAIEALDAAEEAGVMGLVCLYHSVGDDGLRPAGDDRNIEKTIRIVEAVKDHPALFGYGVMDEVFAQISGAEPLLEASYRLIRGMDKKHPVTTMEALQNYYGKAAKFVDVLCIDPYSAAYQQNAADSTAAAVEVTKGEKPVYALLWAYYNGDAYPTYNDGRNNNWQAVMSGAAAVGYYSVSDSDTDDTTGTTRPIWEARDDGAFWNGIVEFAEKEKEIAFDRFVFKKYNSFAEEKTDTYWYSAWHTGSETYAIVLGLTKNGVQNISVPMDGTFRAEILAGRAAEEIYGEGELSVSITGTEALLYRIVPFRAMGSIQNADGHSLSVIPPGKTVMVSYQVPVFLNEELQVICAVYEESKGNKELVEIHLKNADNAGDYSGFWLAEAKFTLHGGTRERTIGLFVWDSSSLSPICEGVHIN